MKEKILEILNNKLNYESTAILEENLDDLADELETLFSEITEAIDDEIKSYYGSSTHGNCCTCGNCKNFHDDCMCAEIEALDKLKSKLNNLLTLTK